MSWGVWGRMGALAGAALACLVAAFSLFGAPAASAGVGPFPHGLKKSEPADATIPRDSAPRTDPTSGLSSRPPRHDPRRAAPRIVGGAFVRSDQVPWQVAVLAGDFLCGGTLVAPRLVITAGHCVYDDGFIDPAQISVIGGRTNLSSGEGRHVSVSRYRLPTDAEGRPLYAEHHTGHSIISRWDVALLELAEGVPGAPIKIAGPDETGLWGAGQPLLASGWGATDYDGRISTDSLKAATVVAFGDATCAWAYQPPDFFSSEDMLCASGIGRDACRGDSGGPLAAGGANGQIRLVGTTSWGGDAYGPVCAGTAGVYARVAADPLRSQLQQLAHELTGDEIVGSGAGPGSSSPPLTYDEALQFTYNQSRDECLRDRLCRAFGDTGCSPSGAGFSCGIVNFEKKRRYRFRCTARVLWSLGPNGEINLQARRWRCRRGW